MVFLITLGVAFGGFALTFITCGLGGIIAYPAAGALTGLIHVYTYRRLTGAPSHPRRCKPPRHMPSGISRENRDGVPRRIPTRIPLGFPLGPDQ